MAKYSKRKDGRYVANRTIRGRRKVFYGKTVKEVDEKIEAYLQHAEDGRFFQEVADEWMVMKEATVAESTSISYRRPKARITEAFKGRRIREIKPRELQAYIHNFAKLGYSKSTVHTELTVLKQICSFGITAGDLDVNPATTVKMPKGLESKKRPALTKEQEMKVRNCKSGDWWLLGQMLMYTGLRRGELLALRWEDIDRKKKVIHVTKKINYSGCTRGRLEHHLKSKNGARDVRLFRQLDQLLPRNRIGLIFTNDKGTNLWSGQLQKAWNEYCTAADLVTEDGKPQVTPHQFRHLFATLCFEADIPARTTAKWMGDTIAVVEDIYQELRPDKEDEGGDQMDDYLDQLAAE